MYVNKVGDFIKSVFPSLVNKDASIFKALLANEDETGTLESLWNDVEKERKAWCSKHSIYELEGEQLEKTLQLFSVLTKQKNEDMASFVNLNKLLFTRGGLSVWGTTWDIKNLFKTILKTRNIWLVNNCKEYTESLLTNGNFESKDGWTLENCEYSNTAKFEETTGILFDTKGTLKQTAFVKKDGSYFLHFFLLGSIKVCIKNDKNLFWNPELGEFGEWSEKENFILFSSKEWNNKSLFFITESDTEKVEIIFSYVNEKTFLDYARLFEKTRESIFSLITIYDGLYTDETANLAPGTNDPIKHFDYENNGYFSEGNEDVKEQDFASKQLSFFNDENSALIKENVSPILDAKQKDIAPLTGYENMTYADETKALAPQSPVEKDVFPTVDYNKMSYFDNAYIFGAKGESSPAVYKTLLEILQPAGITGIVEILTREEG